MKINKEKVNQIKNKIKQYTPEIIAGASLIAIAVLASQVKKSWYQNRKDWPGFEPLPEVIGEEKQLLLARKDTILQKIEDDLYFLSTASPEIEN